MSIQSDLPRPVALPVEASPATLAARERIALQLGWWFVAIPFLAFGVQHLWLGRFVTRLAPALPAWVPAQTVVAYIVGVTLIAASIAMIADQRRGRFISIVLGALILVSFVVTHIPRLVARPGDIIMWLQALKGLTLASGAFAVAATASLLRPPASGRFSLGGISDQALLTIANTIMGVYLIYCGLLHLNDPVGVARLVPTWIPGAVGWAWFTGVALVLGGFGFWLPRVRGLAAALSSLMIFLWVLMLHAPRAASTRGINETTSTFEALAFSGLALIIAVQARSKANSSSLRH
jgi:uncharacterized membrane protein